ncbi:MAG: PfkB family carbohydrate kinase [Bowdeniella nasicola]|nr:PfkB family carbohydrate kinase [Bowdeniella nasicola]
MSRFISTGSCVLDLPMNLPHFPVRGGDVIAHSAGALVGGGFNVVSAVARQGIETCLASPLGTGANSAQVRYELESEGIEHVGETLVGDTGLCLTLREPDGERTFITTLGVEAEPSHDEFEDLTVEPGDVVYVSGYDLAYPMSAPVVSRFAADLPNGVTLVVDTGPIVDEIDLDVLTAVLRRCDLLSLNRREAGLVQEITGVSERFAALRSLVSEQCAVLVRAGSEGCWVQPREGEIPARVPAFEIEVADTTGSGDAHTGVVAASLMEGLDLRAAIRRANAAAGIAATRVGPATCPTRREIDDFLALESGSKPISG